MVTVGGSSKKCHVMLEILLFGSGGFHLLALRWYGFSEYQWDSRDSLKQYLYWHDISSSSLSIKELHI